jgi:DNA-binding transcriptional MerR regulator
MPDAMTIGDVARRSGVPASTIRYYERLGVLPPARRRGGKRRYDVTVLDALAIIRFATHVGLTLAETRELLGGRAARPKPERWREVARRRLGELDALIDHAQRLRAVLHDTLRHECPKLVERGKSLPR